MNIIALNRLCGKFIVAVRPLGALRGWIGLDAPKNDPAEAA